MHYSTKRRIALGMTTGGLLMTGLGMSSAHADTTATGGTTHSPGVGSGNLIQLPINAPINVCGNQLDVVGILDSVTGNSCENHSGSSSQTTASGSSSGSPGVGSGNLIQLPINAPINICGNQLDVIGIGNSDQGNSCENHGGGSTTASGGSSGSPGIVAGNLLQVPINAPINVCGNQVDVIGILNSVTGNSCENNGHGSKPPQPSPSPTPPPTPTPTPTGTSCGCPPPPPPPPPSTPCPPSGTTTPTPASHSSTSAATPSASTTGGNGGSSGGGSNGGGTSGSSGGSGNSGSNGGSSGKPTGNLAQTGSGALAAAPFGAGLLGGGVLLRKRFSIRSR